MNFIVTYDVRDDRRRSRVSARLALVGVRIQRSVFHCILEPSDVEAFISDCEALIDLETDVLQVFCQCEGCRRSQVSLGQVNLALEQAFWVV